MKLLVTGGAGYVGSAVAAHLVHAGHDVTVLDDLSTGHADAVPGGATLVHADIRAAGDVLADGYDGVLHFAAKSLVAESVRVPAHYWDNNLGGTLALLDSMRQTGCDRLVFSSTAAVYGDPESNPITEDAPARPTNPYGQSKLAVDTAIGEYARREKLGAVSLRYFNVAGASKWPSATLGERHDPETHLIPIMLQVALGTRDSVRIYGEDYPTRDGTCVRDYIHIDDLARAHMLALDSAQPGEHAIYNLGNGEGFSVREMVEAAREVTGHPLPARSDERRAGDPPTLVASTRRAADELGWQPRVPSLNRIISDAWDFTHGGDTGGQ